MTDVLLTCVPRLKEPSRGDGLRNEYQAKYQSIGGNKNHSYILRNNYNVLSGNFSPPDENATSWRRAPNSQKRVAVTSFLTVRRRLGITSSGRDPDQLVLTGSPVQIR